MITEDEAIAKVLAIGDADGVPLAIMACERSPRSDYWVIRANSEAYVVDGLFDRMLIGVSAYLVRVADGEITLVGSGQLWQEVLQDKYDAAAAGAMHYVLEPTADRHDKAAMLLLRQQLRCSMQAATRLLSDEYRGWLTGLRRRLLIAQTVLGEKGIDTRIVLRRYADNAPEMDDRITSWDMLAARIRSSVEP